MQIFDLDICGCDLSSHEVIKGVWQKCLFTAVKLYAAMEPGKYKTNRSLNLNLTDWLKVRLCSSALKGTVASEKPSLSAFKPLTFTVLALKPSSSIKGEGRPRCQERKRGIQKSKKFTHIHTYICVHFYISMCMTTGPLWIIVTALITMTTA